MKAGLRETQQSVNTAARANITYANEQVRANQTVALSFKETGEAAGVAASQEVAAQTRVAVAAKTASAEVVAGARRSGEAIDTLKETTFGFAKVLGLAFGVEIVGDFVKETVQGAASLQKQVEVINAEFGKFGESVAKFGETGAKSLGISAIAADTTSARFGILFQNLGIGQEQAAKMTIGFEQLAGSLSAVQGKDPSEVLQKIVLAAAGNTRGLKQLGIVVDTTAEKVALFKAGIIATTNQAITPAQKAIAIYLIATQRLPQDLALAAQHSGDYVNVQRRLSAEWSNAKDALGAGLLPVLTVVASDFAVVLPPAVEATRAVFRALADDVKGIAKIVGPAIAPIAIRVREVFAAFKVGGTSGGFDSIVKNFEALSPAAKLAVGAIGAVTAAIVVMLAAAFPITAAVAAIVGLGVAFDQAYTHSAKFRDIVHEIGDAIKTDVLPAIKEGIARATPAIQAFEDDVVKAFETIKVEVKVAVAVFSAIWSHFGSTIRSIAKTDFGAVIKIVKDNFKIIGDQFDFVRDVLTGKWSAAWGAIKDTLKRQLDITVTVFESFVGTVESLFTGLWQNVEKGVLEGVIYITNILSKIPTSFKVFGRKVGFDNPFKGITDELNEDLQGINAAAAAKKAADKIAAAIAAALKAKENDASIVGAAAAIGASIGSAVAAGAAATGENPAEKAAQAAAAQAAAAAALKAKKAVASAKDALNSAKDQVTQTESSLSTLKQSLAVALSTEVQDVYNAVEDAKSNLLSIGQSLSQSLSTIFDQPFVLAGQKIQDAQDRLSLIFDRKSAALTAQANRISYQQSLLGVASDKLALFNLRRQIALPGGRSLSADPKVALAELNKLAKSATGENKGAIEAFILQYKTASLQVAGDKNNLKQQALNNRKSVLTTALQLKSDLLTVEQDTANRLKTQITKQIADLTNAFNRHVITYAQFKKGIEDIVAKGTPAFKKAGKTLGTAFADQFQEEVTDILKQAGFIDRGPKVKGTTGQDTRLVRPLQVYQKDQLAIDKIRNQIASKTKGLTEKILKESQKQSTYLQTLASATTGQVSTSGRKNPGSQSKTSKSLTGTGG